jgi:hypothetical protein
VVPAAPTGEAAELAARLARVEAEAAALRDEVAALREDLEWLAGLDEEPELAAARGNVFTRGWLATGWARASLVLASLGLVMVVSVPYLMHLLGPADAADRHPAVAALAPRPVEPAPVEPARAEVAPARLDRAATPKARAAVARSRARVRSAASAPEPAPAPDQSR